MNGKPDRKIWSGRVGIGHQLVDAPVIWLATVIVRSRTDWTQILDRLVTVQGLGSLSDRAAEIASQGARFNISAREGEGKEVPSVYGF